MINNLFFLRIFFICCMALSLFLVIRPDIGARWAYKMRCKNWNLKEDSLIWLTPICRYWNLFMFLVFCYLLITIKNS